MVTLISVRHFGVPRTVTPVWQEYGGSIQGSVNLCETFWQISEVWGNAHTLNLEKCLLSLFSLRSHFLDFIHLVVFDLFFIAWQWKRSITTIPVHLVILCRGLKLSEQRYSNVARTTTEWFTFLFIASVYTFLYSHQFYVSRTCSVPSSSHFQS